MPYYMGEEDEKVARFQEMEHGIGSSSHDGNESDVEELSDGRHQKLVT